MGNGGSASAGEFDTSGAVELELRWFPDEPAFPEQREGVQPSVILTPELDYKSEEGRHQVAVDAFLRLDGWDDQRTHFDLREAYWRYIGDKAELLVGIDKVFWGVSESRHLVNIINQADAVEDIDEEDKLGQPMLALGLQRDWGRLDAYALVGFRERTFPGSEGRLRTPFPVDTDEALFESAAGNQRVDLALRYSHYLGNWDLGASAFYGTSRQPKLLPDPDNERFVPLYQVIQQFGVDVQYTRGAWLWKLESILRGGQGSTFGAVVAGFEYTLFRIGGTGVDLGLLAEYLGDGRDETAPVTVYDDDVFLGTRLALNDSQDSQALLGAIIDRNDGSVAALLEASRRLNGLFTLEIESRFFFNVDRDSFLYAFNRDSLLAARLSLNF